MLPEDLPPEVGVRLHHHHHRHYHPITVLGNTPRHHPLFHLQCMSSTSGLPSRSEMVFKPSRVPFNFSYSSFTGKVIGNSSSTLSVTWGFCNDMGTFSQSYARFALAKSWRFHTNILLDHLFPDWITYPASTPYNPFGSNLELCSLSRASLGLNITFAPSGILGPLNFSLCIFSSMLSPHPVLLC